MSAVAEPPQATPPPPSSAMSAAFDALDSFPPGPEVPQPSAPATPPPAPEPAPLSKAVDTKVEIPDVPKPPAQIELDEIGLPKIQPKSVAKAPEPEIKGPKELREAYQKLKDQLAEFEPTKAELAELKAKLSTAPQIKPEEIEKPWREKLTAAEQAKAELEERIKFFDYKQSREYQESYERPLIEAQKAAMDDLDGLLVTDSAGVERAATIHDLMALQRMPGGQAAKVAAEAFKEAAPIVLQHVQKMKELSKASDGALSTWKEKGSQFQAEQQRAQQEQVAQTVKQYEDTPR